MTVAFAVLYFIGYLSCSRVNINQIIQFIFFYVTAFSTWVSFRYLCYDNFNMYIFKRLVREPSCYIVMGFMALLLFEDFSLFLHRTIFDRFTSIMSTVFFVSGVIMLLLIDAVNVKRKWLTMSCGFAFLTCCVYNIVTRTLLVGVDHFGVSFTISGVPIYRTSVLRSIFVNTLTLTARGLFSIFSDPKVERSIWVYDHCYVDTLSTFVDPFLLSTVKRDVRTVRFQKFELWYCGGTFSLFFLWILNAFVLPESSYLVNFTLFIAVYFLGQFLPYLFILKQNVNPFVISGLVRQVSLWIVVLFALLLVVIDAIVYNGTYSGFAPALSYATGVLQLLLLDAVRVKSRGFVLYVATLCVLVNTLNLLQVTFLPTASDLLVQSFWGVTISLKDVKRTIFINICTLLVKGIWFLFRDKRGDKLMWLEGRIYRMPEEDQTQYALEHSEEMWGYASEK